MSGKKSILIARFPYQNAECPDVGSWLARAVRSLKKDERFDRVSDICLDDTPIPMTRNKAVKIAQAQEFDYLCMVDSDMKPDCHLGQLPLAKPFLPSSLDYVLATPDQPPCVIMAPYCGPPPICNVYVFRWTRQNNEAPDPDWKLSQFGREEGALWTGLGSVDAGPTGLILIDLRVLALLEPPYFEYEYADAEHTEKATTEDVYFTRNAAFAGARVLCNWDAWAGHHKRFLVEKPRPIFADEVQAKHLRALEHGLKTTNVLRQVVVADGKIREMEGAQDPGAPREIEVPDPAC